ncbi:unnamed protein product [Closterium sp. NIES-54]
MVTTTTPGGQRVSICTCTRTGCHLATFTRRPGSSPVAPPCSCRLLSHQTLLWHHRLGHPSLPRLHGMHSRLLVSGLPRSLTPLPPSPASPCLPCVEGPAPVSGQGRERYFLLVVDDYTRYTTVFLLRSKGEVPDVLIPWIRAVRLQLRERFGQDLPVLRLHFDRGGEFSSDLLWEFFMEVARTSMIHAAAPHFLWPFAVRYAAHQLNLWPRVSLPETSSTLRWTGKVGNASVFRVWGSRAFVRDTSADKLSARAIPCGPAPSGVSQIDPLPSTLPVEVTIDSGAARGAASGGAAFGGGEPVGTEREGAESEGGGYGEPGGAKPERAELGGAEPERTEPGGTSSTGGPLGAFGSGESAARGTGAPGPGGTGAAGAGGIAGVGAAGNGAGVAGGTGAAGPEGARTRGTGAAGAGGAARVGAGGTGAGAAGGTGVGAAGGTGAAGPGGARTGGTGAAGAGSAAGIAARDPGTGDPEAGGPGAVSAGSGDTGRPRPYFVLLLQHVLGLPSSTGLTPPFLCPPRDHSQPPLHPAYPLRAPSPYTEHTGGLTERRVPMSRPASLVRAIPTGCRCVPVPSPPASSLADGPDHESDLACAASPTVTRLLATVVIDPSFESAAASALVAELVDFAAACRLDYAASLVAESESDCPPSVGGECALDTDVLEDRQEDFECFAAAVPHLVSMLIAPEGDPDAPDIPTPRSYAEAITVPPSGANIVDGMWIFRVKRSLGSPPAFKARYVARGFSQREGVYFFQTFSPTPKCQRSTGDPRLILGKGYRLVVLGGYGRIDPLLNKPFYPNGLVVGILTWYQSEGLEFESQCVHFGHPSAGGCQRSTGDPRLIVGKGYRLVVLGGYGRTDPLLNKPFYPNAPPSDESVEPSGPYPKLVGCLMYLMTCTRPDLAYPFSILARYVAPGRHRPEHWEAAKRVLRYLCSTSGMGLVLGGQGPVVLTVHADASWVDDLATQQSSQDYTFSLGSGSVSWRSTHSSSVLSSSCEAEIYAGAMAAQELCWLTYLLTDLGERPRSSPVLYVDNKAMIALCQEHKLEHRTKHIALRYFFARELQQRGQLRLAYVATRANTADIFTKALREESLATPGNRPATTKPKCPKTDLTR